MSDAATTATQTEAGTGTTEAQPAEVTPPAAVKPTPPPAPEVKEPPKLAKARAERITRGSKKARGSGDPVFDWLMGRG